MMVGRTGFFFCLLLLLTWGSPTLAASLTSVRVVTLGEEQAQASRRFVGRVDAITSVDLAFQVGGKITELPFQPGQRLAKGQLLAALDPVDYQLALERTKIEVQRAQRDVERKASLLERQALPVAAYDEAKDLLRLAQVAQQAAQRELDLTRIYAPFEALVARRLQETHQLIQPGTPVVRVHDVTELRVQISVPEDLIHRVTQPEHFKAWLKRPGKEPLALEYREHITEPDPVVQTYAVTLGREQLQDAPLLPGRTVTVLVEARASRTSELRLPVSALLTQPDGQYFVWVYSPETGQVTARPIQVGDLSGESVTVLAGLEAGEQVVSTGGRHLSEGKRVRPFEHF